MASFNGSSGGDSGRARQAAGTAAAVLSALVLSLLPVTAQRQIASVLRATLLRPFVVVQEGVATGRLGAADAERLRARSDSMAAELAGYRTLEQENRRLRDLVGLRGRVGPDWLSAGALRPGTVGSESMFQLDVGSEDGVEPNAPVIDAYGVVGQVVEVYPRHAIGIDWTHPDFRVSAMDSAGASYGMVESRRGEFREADRLVFDGIGYFDDLRPGTPVRTSGLGGIWPRGIPVGKVAELAEADEGWRKSYWMLPAVDVGGVTNVLVAREPQLDGDLSDVWPAATVQTSAEAARLAGSLEDSLVILADSIALLERILDALPAGRDRLAEPGRTPDAAGTGPPPPGDSTEGR